jgi:tetratricopeptide (TPR) repeat protein
MTDVDPGLVKDFNRAAKLGRDGAHAASAALYEDVVRRAARRRATASPAFVATARTRRAFCLMDLERYEDARTELQAASKLEQHLSLDGRYELLFALGNTLGALGHVDQAFTTLVSAIRTAEDMNDYTERPARCWGRILAIGVDRKAWSFVEDKAKIALDNARLRPMPELASIAASLLRALPELRLGGA